MTVLRCALRLLSKSLHFLSRVLRSLSKSLHLKSRPTVALSRVLRSLEVAPYGRLKPPLGIEPKTFSLQVKCSTAELKRHWYHHPGVYTIIVFVFILFIVKLHKIVTKDIVSCSSENQFLRQVVGCFPHVSTIIAIYINNYKGLKKDKKTRSYFNLLFT